MDKFNVHTKKFTDKCMQKLKRDWALSSLAKSQSIKHFLIFEFHRSVFDTPKFQFMKHNLWDNSTRFDRTNYNLGCVSLGKSESGFLIQDHSDHGALKEPTNPYPEWIRRFL